jgi:hypothetical protein
LALNPTEAVMETDALVSKLEGNDRRSRVTEGAAKAMDARMAKRVSFLTIFDDYVVTNLTSVVV